VTLKLVGANLSMHTSRFRKKCLTSIMERDNASLRNLIGRLSMDPRRKLYHDDF
jgi:hypothetical protein